MIERIILTDLIRQNFIAIKQAHTSIFGDYTIEVGDEDVIYKKASEQNPRSIYIAISYSSGNFIYNFGTQSFVLNVISDMNAGQSISALYGDYSVAWQLLELYYQTYNLTTATLSDSSSIKQTYNTPTTLINFEEIGAGLRSLIAMSGTFNITASVLDIKKLQYVPQLPATLGLPTIIDIVITNGRPDTEDSTGIYIQIPRTSTTGYFQDLFYLDDYTAMDEEAIADFLVSKINTSTTNIIGEWALSRPSQTTIRLTSKINKLLTNTVVSINFDGDAPSEADGTIEITQTGETPLPIRDDTPIDIEFIQAIPTLKITLKPNVFPYQSSIVDKPFSKSVPRFATLILTLTILPSDNALTRKIWGLMLKQESVIDTYFKLNIEITNDLKLENEIFYLDNAPITKNVGEYPSITLTLTN